MLELVGTINDIMDDDGSFILVRDCNPQSLWRYLATNHRYLTESDVLVYESAYDDMERFDTIWGVIHSYCTERRKRVLDDLSDR